MESPTAATYILYVIYSYAPYLNGFAFDLGYFAAKAGLIISVLNFIIIDQRRRLRVVDLLDLGFVYSVNLF